MVNPILDECHKVENWSNLKLISQVLHFDFN